MKISLEWLRDFLPQVPDAPAAADALTHGGLPVEVIEQVGQDTVIDVEVTSNRTDCLSHLGVARELAAVLDRPCVEPRPSIAETTTPAHSICSVRVDAPDLCPHYTARVLQGVRVGPSPAWLVRRLEAIGLRAINNVVDVTNYVMFEMGQPLHAFDFDRLEGRQIVVRRAAKGEKLVTLDGRERDLSADMLAICDARRPVALAGVMGGRDSEVTAQTVNVLLESARFDPLSIRRTARALAMRSDSSYRFERGIDPTLPERASRRAAELLLLTAGGQLLAGDVAAGASGYQPKTLSLRVTRVCQVLGIELSADQIVAALARLRLRPTLEGDCVMVSVPSDRLDLNLEIDLVEEVARIVGYEKIPVRDEVAIRLTPADPSAAMIEQVRATLIAGGYFESVTFGWVSDTLARDFVPDEADPTTPLARVDPMVRNKDASLRPSLLPGLLESVRFNENQGTAGPRLFEIGSTFWNAPGGRIEERRRVAMVGGEDVRSLRGVVEALLGRLAPGRAVTVAPNPAPASPPAPAGRSSGAVSRWGGSGRSIGR